MKQTTICRAEIVLMGFGCQKMNPSKSISVENHTVLCAAREAADAADDATALVFNDAAAVGA